MFNEWDTTKTYKTMNSLMLALYKINENYDKTGLLYVMVPEGSNAGRFTAVFPYRNGENTYWMHQGFKVMG